MKKKVKKVFISVLAASTIMTNTYPVFANKITVNMPYEIYTSNTQEYLASGVSHENIKKFTALGWWNINVIRIDLEDDYTELKGLFNPDGISKRDTVSNMVEKHNAVAGINGDYFNYSPQPSSMGGLISEGEIIISPIELAYALPSFFLTHDNKGGVDYLDRKILVTDLHNGTRVNINTLNKVTTEFDTLTLLNSLWGDKSIGNKYHNDLIEVVVDNDVIVDIRVGQEAINIPKNGYVIAGRGPRAEILQELTIGHKVKLDVETTPNVDKIKFAIGGGSIILKDGELSLTNINSKGANPRTGIGINKNNTEMILVTIDGRDSSFKGVSQEVFGAIMKELGAYNAINLDGGGSTTMAIKPLGEDKAQVVNKPSEGSQRLVVNGVGVVSNAPKGELSYLKMSTDDNKMFVNTSRNIVVKGYDENHNPIKLDPSLFNFSVEGVEGSFDSNKFKSSTSGKANIIVDYNGIKGKLDLTVLDSIKDITANIDDFNIDTNSKYNLPTFYGKDNKGTEAKIYTEDVSFTVTGDIGYVENGVFYSGETANGGALTARAGEGIDNILVSVGLQGKLIDSFEDANKFEFLPYPETVTGSINLSEDAKDGKSSISLKYDFSQGSNTRAAYIMLNPESSGITLEGKPRKLGLWVKGDNSGSWLRALALDSKGNQHYLDFEQTIDWTDWQYVEANIPSSFSYPVKLERIYVVETDDLRKQYGEILLDGLNAYYPSSFGNHELPTETELIDELNKKSDLSEDGFTFTVGYDYKNIDEIMKYEVSKSITSIMNKSKIGITLNSISDEFKSKVKNYAFIDASVAYRTSKHMDTLFINLNSSKNGIRETDSSQWIKLKQDIDNRNESNFVIFLPTPIFGGNGFSDKLEAELLHDTLVQAHDNGKNIIVVHGGNTTSTDLKDGIRYIGLNTKDLQSPEDIKNINLVKFYVNNDKISYELIKVFK
ncbi:MAG: phosphodiester glycosidase family protein [Tissierellaceae bacterium]|nr:phosphodiester glycosidase family protein [Tissierellaceae bacterium]